MSQYAKAINLAHGLGCVKDKPEDDFKEMLFSLDFFVSFFIKEKRKTESSLSIVIKLLRSFLLVQKGTKKDTTNANPNSDCLRQHALSGYPNCGSHRSWTPAALFALLV